VDPMQRRPDWDALMRAAVGGDAKSYKTLLETLPGFLRSITRRGYARFGVEPNDVEDVVQEVLLAIHLKRHTWKIGAPVAPWIMAIARHKLIDALRRRGRHVHISIETMMDALEDKAPETQPDRQTDLHDALRLLDQLRPRQREIVRSISIDGHSIGDVAHRLDMSEGNVRVVLHRALKTLAMIYRKSGP
jgi:RNA polymerase sigma factor (sigma-70 family)